MTSSLDAGRLMPKFLILKRSQKPWVANRIHRINQYAIPVK